MLRNFALVITECGHFERIKSNLISFDVPIPMPEITCPGILESDILFFFMQQLQGFLSSGMLGFQCIKNSTAGSLTVLKSIHSII